MMEFVNDALHWGTKPVPALRDFLILLQPFAPHVAEELWAKLHARFPWPRLIPLSCRLGPAH